MSGSKNRTNQEWKLIHRAQRAIPLAGKSCERCGSTDRLERHHPQIDRSNPKVRILCKDCHIDCHKRRGDWPN